MSFNRSDIRTGIRDKLSAWPRVTTTLNGALTSSATSLTLTSGTGVEERMLLEIVSETIEVIASSGTSVSEAVRGARGSTAAAQSNGATVKGYPFWGWTDLHLNRIINQGIAWMKQGKVWTLVPKTNTWLANYKEFGLPTGVVYPTGDIVKKVELWDEDRGDSGDWREILTWRHQGDRILTNQQLTEDTEVRLWIQQHQPQLSSDGTNLDNDDYLECLVMYVTGRCLDELLANRTRYYEYSASLNDRASTPDELQRSAYFFKNQADVLRDEISRPGLSGYAAIQKP